VLEWLDGAWQGVRFTVVRAKGSLGLFLGWIVFFGDDPVIRAEPSGSLSRLFLACPQTERGGICQRFGCFVFAERLFFVCLL
jgi:hypothetical protein